MRRRRRRWKRRRKRKRRRRSSRKNGGGVPLTVPGSARSPACLINFLALFTAVVFHFTWESHR